MGTLSLLFGTSGLWAQSLFDVAGSNVLGIPLGIILAVCTLFGVMQDRRQSWFGMGHTIAVMVSGVSLTTCMVLLFLSPGDAKTIEMDGQAVREKGSVVWKWNLPPGITPAVEVNTFPEDGKVSDLAVTPDGITLAALLWYTPELRTELHLWDVPSQRLRARVVIPAFIRDMTITPDGHKVDLHIDGGRHLLYDLATGNPAGERNSVYPRIPSTVNSVSESADGRLLAFASYRILFPGIPSADCALGTVASSSVAIWDLQKHCQVTKLHGMPDATGTLVFSLDNRLLATGTDDHIIRIWEIPTGKLLQMIKVFSTIDPAFSLDASLLIAPDGRVFDVRTGQIVSLVERQHNPYAFFPDGRQVACTTNMQPYQIKIMRLR